MQKRCAPSHTSFAHREVVAPVGLWERGDEASGIIPPSSRLLPVHSNSHAAKDATAPTFLRAPKANATSPTGETRPCRFSIVSGGAR